MKKWNVLIVGAGGQGSEADLLGSANQNKYISYAHAFKDDERTGELFFTDKDIDKAANAAKAWKTKEIFSNVKYAFKLKLIDIAIVATPDDAHYEILKELAEYPLKLVITEKPLCTDLNQAREIIELYKAKGIPLMVDYTRRFIPELQALKQKTPKYGVCLYNRGLLHTGSHGIDFFNMLGLKNYKLEEVKEDYRYWSIAVMFEDGSVWTEQRVKNDPVPSYFDNHMKYVVNNAYGFLEGKEELLCSGEDALKALERCFELMEKKDDKCR